MPAVLNDASGSIVWYFLWIFAFAAYLMVAYSIVGDLVRDHALPGWAKALWIVFLLFVPFLTALVYLVARGRGMAERSRAAARKAQRTTEDYIRHVAATGPAEEIGKAKALLDDGAITSAEFDRIKAGALSVQGTPS